MKKTLLFPAMTFIAILGLAFVAQAQSTDPLDTTQATPAASASPSPAHAALFCLFVRTRPADLRRDITP